MGIMKVNSSLNCRVSISAFQLRFLEKPFILLDVFFGSCRDVDPLLKLICSIVWFGIANDLVSHKNLSKFAVD